MDGLGRAYVCGWTKSDERTFPVRVGPFLKHSGMYDAFVARINPSGTGLDYCGYIGGIDDDETSGCALGPGGDLFVYGITHSTSSTSGFPVKLDPITHGIGLTTALPWSPDHFLARVKYDGTELYFAGLVGGADGPGGLSVDRSGNAYLTGSTNSQTFPATVGPSLVRKGGGLFSCFVTKVDSSVVSVGKACGGLKMTTQPWSVGRRYTLTVTGATPWARGLLVISLVPRVYLEITPGCRLYIDPTRIVAVVGVQADGNGVMTFSDTIAANPLLEGAVVAAQAAFYPVSTPPGFVSTNGLVITVKR